MNIVPYKSSANTVDNQCFQIVPISQQSDKEDDVDSLMKRPVETCLLTDNVPRGIKIFVRKVLDPILSQGIKNACEGCQEIIPYRFQFWKSSSPASISDTPLNAAAQSVQESSLVESSSRSLIEDHAAWRLEMECILYQNRPAESSRERAPVSGASPSLIVSQSSIRDQADFEKGEAILKIQREIVEYIFDVKALVLNTQRLNVIFLEIFKIAQECPHPIMTEEWVRNTLTNLKNNISETVNKLGSLKSLSHIPFIDVTIPELEWEGGENFKEKLDSSWEIAARAKLEIIAVYHTYVQVYELSNAAINLKNGLGFFTSETSKDFDFIADKIKASHNAIGEAKLVLEASVQSEGSQEWERKAFQQTQIGIDNLSERVLEATKTVLKELTTLAEGEIQKLVESGNTEKASAKLEHIDRIERSVCGPVTDFREPLAFGNELNALKVKKDVLVAQIATTEQRKKTIEYRTTAAFSGIVVGSLAYGALTLIGFGINRFSQLR